MRPTQALSRLTSILICECWLLAWPVAGMAAQAVKPAPANVVNPVGPAVSFGEAAFRRFTLQTTPIGVPDLFPQNPRLLSILQGVYVPANGEEPLSRSQIVQIRAQYDAAQNAAFAQRLSVVHERIGDIAEQWGFSAGALDSPAGILIAPKDIVDHPVPRSSSDPPVLRDHWRRLGIRASRLWWYNVPRLLEKWKNYRQDYANRSLEGERAVEDARALFAETIALGTLRGEVLGYTNYSHPEAINDAWKIFRRHFKEARNDTETVRAFDRLISRALVFNNSRHPRKFRDLLTSTLRRGARLPSDELKDYFNSSVSRREVRFSGDFQKEDQGRTLGTFFSLVHETLREEESLAASGSRVLGLVLVGSFAVLDYHAYSDLDVKLVTKDGTTSRQKAFISRLREKWNKVIYGQPGPSHNWEINPFHYALPLSRQVILSLLGREPHVVITSDARLAKLLATGQRLSSVGFSETARAGKMSRLQKAVYTALIKALLWAYDLVIPAPQPKMFPFWDWETSPFIELPSFRQVYPWSEEGEKDILIT